MHEGQELKISLVHVNEGKYQGSIMFPSVGKWSATIKAWQTGNPEHPVSINADGRILGKMGVNPVK